MDRSKFLGKMCIASFENLTFQFQRMPNILREKFINQSLEASFLSRRLRSSSQEALTRIRLLYSALEACSPFWDLASLSLTIAYFFAPVKISVEMRSLEPALAKSKIEIVVAGRCNMKPDFDDFVRNTRPSFGGRRCRPGNLSWSL